MAGAARTSVTIVSPREARTASSPQGRWVYFGKDVKTRREIESVWRDARHPFVRPLSAVVAQLRQPFLDFVADVGSSEPDAVAWWSTTFSWKVWGASDFFLLVCYLKAAEEVIEAARVEAAPITLVVEDPWLAVAIAENVDGVRLPRGRSSLVGARVTALLLGLARRIAWLGQTVSSWWRYRQLASTPSDTQATAVPPTAAIYTYPMERCLRPEGGYADALLPGMDEVLRRAGHTVGFISPPERRGLERELAERRAYIRPLIQYATFGAVIRSLCAGWRPRRRSWPAVAGLCVDSLARREFWVDASRAAWCRYRFFFECAGNYLRRVRPEWVVFPFENQPWEKLLVLAARAAGTRSAGVQHSTLGTNYLSYFLGRADVGHLPLPDVVLTAGVFPDEMLRASGYPEDGLIMAGSLRYGDQFAALLTESPLEPPAGRVLVALPIDRPMCEHLVAALGAAFPDGGSNDGLAFVVKSHPMTPVDPAAFGLAATVAAGSFAEALRDCGTVIYVGSTTGPEAAAQGRTVVRYECGLLVDVDVSGPMASNLPVCRDETIRQCLLTAVRGGTPPPVSGAAVRQLFGPVDRPRLHAVFARAARAAGA